MAASAATAAGSVCGPFRFRPARLRFPAHHPFFEEGDVQRHLSLCQATLALSAAQSEEEAEGGGGEEAQLDGRRAEVRCHFQGCGEAFASLGAFEHHYDLLHRDVCSACRRAFPSRRLLDLHLLEQHGAALFQLQAQQRSMFQCLVEGCPEAFRSPEDRKEHLVTTHCYPPDFRFDKTPKHGSRAKARRPQSGKDDTEPMEVADQKEGAVEEEAMPTADAMEEEEPRGSLQTQRQATPRERPLRSRVPASISFGQGAPRAFEGRSSRRKRP
nr:zinc finger protein 511 isoform X1 [Anolis sagrei ordinatus]